MWLINFHWQKSRMNMSLEDGVIFWQTCEDNNKPVWNWAESKLYLQSLWKLVNFQLVLLPGVKSVVAWTESLWVYTPPFLGVPCIAMIVSPVLGDGWSFSLLAQSLLSLASWSSFTNHQMPQVESDCIAHFSALLFSVGYWVFKLRSSRIPASRIFKTLLSTFSGCPQGEVWSDTSQLDYSWKRKKCHLLDATFPETL